MHWPGHRCTCPSDKVLLKICHARGGAGGGQGEVRASRFSYLCLPPLALFRVVVVVVLFLHFSPTSPPVRTLASLPFLSRLPYPSRPLFSRVPTPLSPSTRFLSLAGGVTV